MERPSTPSTTFTVPVEFVSFNLTQSTAKSRDCRPPGAPAGVWPHTPWHHCVFYDPYERVNVWSHGIPGFLFILLGVASYMGWVVGGSPAWIHNPLGMFCLCAATTHLLSALTHVYPDSIALEKLDHIGIVVLILGTPITIMMAQQHGVIPADMVVSAVFLFLAAFLPPLFRVLGFASGVGAMVFLHGASVCNANLLMQLLCYGIGGYAFLRNGGHNRFPGLTDHHFLHYFVTVACGLHVWNLLAWMGETPTSVRFF
eukprot:jgi/Botrbrau1/3533/Bobra.341_2s0059.1